MTRTEEVKRLPRWKSPLRTHDHVDQHIVSLSLHQLGGAPKSVDGKVSLRHFSGRPLHLLKWTPPWTGPTQRMSFRVITSRARSARLTVSSTVHLAREGSLLNPVGTSKITPMSVLIFSW